MLLHFGSGFSCSKSRVLWPEDIQEYSFLPQLAFRTRWKSSVQFGAMQCHEAFETHPSLLGGRHHSREPCPCARGATTLLFPISASAPASFPPCCPRTSTALHGTTLSLPHRGNPDANPSPAWHRFARPTLLSTLLSPCTLVQKFSYAEFLQTTP